MGQLIQTPKGMVEFPDEMGRDEITAVLEKEFNPQKPPTLVEAGWENLKGDVRTGVANLLAKTGMPEYSRSVAKQAEENYKAGQRPDDMTLEKADGIGDYGRLLYEQGVQSLPGMGPVVAGGIAGAPFGPVGSLVGAFIGSLPQFFGGNVRRQMEERGLSVDQADTLKAAAAAAAQGASEALITRYLPGMGKAGSGRLLTRMATKGLEGAAVEGGTEALQQALEILQANPDKLWDMPPEVRREIATAALVGAGIGGGLGTITGAGKAAEKPLPRGVPRLPQDMGGTPESPGVGLPEPPETPEEPYYPQGAGLPQQFQPDPSVMMPEGSEQQPTPFLPQGTGLPQQPTPFAPDPSVMFPEPTDYPYNPQGTGLPQIDQTPAPRRFKPDGSVMMPEPPWNPEGAPVQPTRYPEKVPDVMEPGPKTPPWNPAMATVPFKSPERTKTTRIDQDLLKAIQQDIWQAYGGGKESLELAKAQARVATEAYKTLARGTGMTPLELYKSQNLTIHGKQADLRNTPFAKVGYNLNPDGSLSIKQKGGGILQGAFAFDRTNPEAARVHIAVTGAYNPTTMMHEFGHVFLEQMRTLSKTNPEAAHHLKALMDSWNITNPNSILTKHHEEFARGFEQFLKEGKAPTKALQPVFQKFKTWLTKLLGSMIRHGEPLSPQAREVYKWLTGGKPPDLGTTTQPILGLDQRVYHGSPHEFEEFGLSKVGSGEGAQAFGHGLYFSENKAVADHYKNKLAHRADIKINGIPLIENNLGGKKTFNGAGKAYSGVKYNVLKDIQKWGSLEEAIKVYEFLEEDASDRAEAKKWNDHWEAAHELMADGVEFTPVKRARTYHVEIPDNDYLHWNLPLSDHRQPASIKKMIEEMPEYQRKILEAHLGRDLWRSYGADFYHGLAKMVRHANNPLEKYPGSPERRASRFLRENGINGIKYPVGTISPGRHSEASNYVLFDDKLPKIVSYESRQRGLGERVRDAIDKYTHPLGNLPDQKKYLIDRMLTQGKQHEIEQAAKKLTDPLRNLDEANRTAAFEYLTNRGSDPNVIPDEKARAAAVDLKNKINQLSSDLVRRGVIDTQSAAAFHDQYLPRVYLKYLIENKGMTGGGIKTGDQSYTRQRKDLSAEERAALGEVKDPGLLGFLALTRPARDIAVTDFHQSIMQNPDWVWQGSLVNWNGKAVTPYWLRNEAAEIRQERIPHMPDGPEKDMAKQVADQMEAAAAQNNPDGDRYDHKLFTKMPDSKAYGPLAGAVVRKEIADDVRGMGGYGEADSVMEKLFGDKGNSLLSRANALWKESKVVWNPPTQVRNYVSNMPLAHIIGGVPFWKVYNPAYHLKAAKEIATNGPYMKMAEKYGLRASTMTESEIRKAANDFVGQVETLNNKKGWRGTFMPVVAAGKAFRAKAHDVYQFSELMGKIMVMQDAIERRKMSPDDAAVLANEALFDYSLVSRNVRFLRNAPTGMPFVTWTSKVFPALAKAMTHPENAVKMGAYIALSQTIPGLVAGMTDIEEKDIETLRKSLSMQMQKRGDLYLLPWKDSHGRWQFMDMGYFFPWQQATDLYRNVRDGNPTEAMRSVGFLSNPLFSAVTAMTTGIDTFTQQPIANKLDPPSKQASDIMKYVWGLAMPPILTQYGAAGKALDATTGTGLNRYGEPGFDATQIAGRAVGANITPVVPDAQRARNLQKMQNELQQEKSRATYNLRDQSLSPEERAAMIKSYVADMQKRQKKMAEYMKETQMSPRLRAATS